MKLADIRKAVEAKYAAFPVEVDDKTTVVLRNALRLPDDDIQSLIDLQGSLKSDDAEASIEDQRATLEAMIVLLAENNGEKLIDAIGGDLPTLMEVVEGWQGATQAGEASASDD